METHIIIIGYIYIKQVFPLTPYDRKRLYFGEIYFIERENRKNLRQTAFIIGKRENKTALVAKARVSHKISIPRIGKNKETCKIMLVVLYSFFENLQTVKRSGILMTYCGVPLQVSAANVFRSTRRVIVFHNAKSRMVFKESVTLHESHGMRIYFRECVPIVFGKTHYAVLYLQFMFAHNRKTTLQKKFVIVQQTSRNSVFYCHESKQRAFMPHFVEHLFKCVATYKLYVFALEILVGRNVVKRTLYTLYCYFLHLCLM